VKWIKVWIECQILACDDDSRSVAHAVSDYAVVFCYANKYIFDLMEGRDFDLEGYAYFCILWRSSRRVALV